MQLASAQLASHLQQGLKTAYVLHGNEVLLMQEAADAIRTAARAQDFTERSVHTVSGAYFDWSEILAASQSQSLFAARQIIEVHIPTGKPGRDGAKYIQQLAENASNNPDNLLLFTLPAPDKTMRNSNWFSALQQHAACVAIETIKRHALPQWIAQRLQQQGQQIAQGAEGEGVLRFFADCVEGNLLAAHQEIQKLGLLYPAGELTAEQIQKAVLHVARYHVFDLSEAIFTGQLARVQRMLDGLQAEGESAVFVHYQLAEDIRALYRVRIALDAGTPMPMALRQQRVWGARERLFERVLPQLRKNILAQLLHEAHVVDGVAKGIPDPNYPSNPWQALYRLANNLSALCSSKQTMFAFEQPA